MLKMTDCIGLSTSQILTQEHAQGIVAIDHSQLQFRREAGIIRRRHDDFRHP